MQTAAAEAVKEEVLAVEDEEAAAHTEKRRSKAESKALKTADAYVY